MYDTHRAGQGTPARLTLALATVIVLTAAIAPAAATATATTTVFVTPATTTITPAGSTGGTVNVSVAFNAGVAVSGAGAALAFNKTRLHLTSVSKDATEVANGVSYAGFPSAGSLASFIADANTAGQIPTIGWSYFDGTSFEPAGADHGIFNASFTVITGGDSTLTPVIVPAFGGLLDGTVADYGSPVTIDTLANGTVANSAPTASVTALPTWQASNSLSVTWAGTPGTNPIASFDVRYRKAAYNGTFGTYATWLAATALSTSSFTTLPGTTYCFSALARDTLGGVSAWTAETCTAAPLDDRSLTRSGAWSLKTGSAYYRSTYLSSTSKGAKLTRTGVKARRIALVASTCSTCGSVQVYWGTKLLKTVSLKGATVNRKVFTIVTFAAVSSGTLSIKVSTTGKKVMIDGVILSAR